MALYINQATNFRCKLSTETRIDFFFFETAIFVCGFKKKKTVGIFGGFKSVLMGLKEGFFYLSQEVFAELF